MMKKYKMIELLTFINWEKYFTAAGFAAHFASIANVQGCDVVRANWLTDFKTEDRVEASEAMQLLKETYRLLALLDRDYEVFTAFHRDEQTSKKYILASASSEIALLFEQDEKKKEIVQRITYSLVDAAISARAQELNERISVSNIETIIPFHELKEVCSFINLQELEIDLKDKLFPNYAQLTELY